MDQRGLPDGRSRLTPLMGFGPLRRFKQRAASRPGLTSPGLPARSVTHRFAPCTPPRTLPALFHAGCVLGVAPSRAFPPRGAVHLSMSDTLSPLRPQPIPRDLSCHDTSVRTPAPGPVGHTPEGMCSGARDAPWDKPATPGWCCHRARVLRGGHGHGSATRRNNRLGVVPLPRE